MIDVPKIVLASGSPRRSEILGFVGLKYEIHVADIDESEKPDESPAEYVKRLAGEKARAVSHYHPGELVLGADTTVVVDSQIVGKPKDLDEARKMISMLSDRQHEVLTGVAVVRRSETPRAKAFESVVEVQSTKVSFCPMTESEIEYLVQNGGPLDKAGAYGIQAEAALFIDRIEGDYWNVVGLPISLVYRMLKSFVD